MANPSRGIPFRPCVPATPAVAPSVRGLALILLLHQAQVVPQVSPFGTPSYEIHTHLEYQFNLQGEGVVCVTGITGVTGVVSVGSNTKESNRVASSLLRRNGREYVLRVLHPLEGPETHADMRVPYGIQTHPKGQALPRMGTGVTGGYLVAVSWPVRISAVPGRREKSE